MARATENPADTLPPAQRNGARSASSGRPSEIKPTRSERQELVDYIKLKLMVAGAGLDEDGVLPRLGIPFEVVAHLRERIRLSYGLHSPISQRAQAFLDRYLAGVDGPRVRLPGLGETFILDRSGMAQELSIPENGDYFQSDIISSYRLLNGQGVLHNPKSDRRTTHGVFHIAEGGLPIPEDKRGVPKHVFKNILRLALQPPADLQRLPFAADSSTPVETFVSLVTRAIAFPEIDGVTPEKRIEVKFVAPGNLISNLDFIERIFGNFGDPHLPDNDAGLDVDGWTGNTGYVILAPHLTRFTKKEVGLPHIDQATVRQKRDRMCWSKEDEIYNDGDAFKLCARDGRGVMLTIIADNYYGYCKKEVKTQLSLAANMAGHAEEEHAGGAQVYPQYDLGKDFSVPTHLPKLDHTFDKVKELFGDIMDLQPEGYGVDKTYSDILYVPEDVEIDLDTQTVSWTGLNGLQKLSLDPRKTYVVPSGFKVRLEKEADSGQWRLIGTQAEGTYCHKPSTVSGGGKSEISKPISDAIKHAPFFVSHFDTDFDQVDALLRRDYSDRFKVQSRTDDSRPILSPKRSLGSVIKLLTPSNTLYTEAYNEWLGTILPAIRSLVFMVKRLYREEMGDNWRDVFSVDVVNGRPGNELKYRDEALVNHFLRVGFTADGKWRMFSLRDDFVPAEKIQREDDITASMVVPSHRLKNLNKRFDPSVSYKIVSNENPERRLFQRPDDAIHRGYDKVTEAHFAAPGNFLSNFEPLTTDDAREIAGAPITFSEFTQPMQDTIRKAALETSGYFVSSAHPRIVDGKPTKNPRYQQIRPDLFDPKPMYLAEIGTRLYREAPFSQSIACPVNAVLPGRRLNPPDASAGIRSLAVYNPIHYQETPELFMELISSLTGKSPSTTGAGSEGALTKGPFNAILPIIDINSAYVSHVLTGTECFVTAAGYVGPKVRVDHDISLLIPEIWSRMEIHERDPKYLIEGNFLEKLEDFEKDGKKVLASRLGYRITAHFMRTFFGIIFDNPNDLFTPEMLRPELQDPESFVDGIDNVVSTQKSIAEFYFQDGGAELACPPVKALLHIMRDGTYEGKDVNDPSIRAMFTREYLLSSDWYAERLKAQQKVDIKLWSDHLAYLTDFLAQPVQLAEPFRKDLTDRKARAESTLAHVKKPAYLDELRGFIGADPSVVID